MKDLLVRFENKVPEIVFEWSDSETDAEGWVVINSLRGGAAGGGTRMRKGLDRREVESLAKTMEVKFSVSGPPIGGAKSGINFDPQDPRKDEVLKRWFKAVTPLLKSYYGTGGDMNVSEVNDVVPITESYGLRHPQEGVVTGHLLATSDEKIRVINQLREGVAKVVEDPKLSPDPSKKYVVSDLITGYGVAQSVVHYYQLYGKSLTGAKVIVQGWGNVGSAAAYYLAHSGCKVVGIIDRVGGLINPDGFSADEITQLYRNKDGNELKAENMLSFDQVNSQIWDLQADVFLPCAASRIITKDQTDRMIAAGIKVIASGANVPFADTQIFYGPIAEHADKTISLIPDFIANCGMARVFAYCMQDTAELTDSAIFSDTSETIHRAIKKVRDRHNQPTHLASTAFEIALEQLI